MPDASGQRSPDATQVEPRASGRGLTPSRVLIGILVVFVPLLLSVIYPGWGSLNAKLGGVHAVSAIVLILLALLLTAVPVTLCIVQGTSKDRQLDRLRSFAGTRLADTTMYRAASRVLESLHPADRGSDYVVPTLVFSVLVLASALLTLLGVYDTQYVGLPSIVLGGTKITELSGQALLDYQIGTLVVLCFAFLGSYCVILSRLIERIGTNDLYPLTFHVFAARLLVAGLVAIVVRHGLNLFGVDSGVALMVIGFVVGLLPDLFLLTLARLLLRRIGMTGPRDDPQARPASMPLRLIDEMSSDEVDRFAELGIDSAQVLAARNPFELMMKLPYELPLLVDWMGQAQLYALVGAERLQALRGMLVPDIFAFRACLADEAVQQRVLAAAGLPEPAAAQAKVLMAQIDANPAFVRLREVRDALRPVTAS